MVIKKIGEFYYDSNIWHYLFMMSHMETNKQKLQFLSDMQITLKNMSDTNITAKRLLDIIPKMYSAIQNNETITIRE